MSRLALYDVSGLLTDLLQKLSGEDGEAWKESLRKMLRKEFEVWKTIKRNPDFKTSKNFLDVLSGKEFRIFDWAKNIMSKDDFKNSLKDNLKQGYDLFLLTTSQLTGKTENGTTQEVFTGAERLGFQKCPAWIGPQLRLIYKDQPNGEWIRIGMEPITGSGGVPGVFVVDCDDSELWLSADCAPPGDVWRPGVLWLFCRPRK